MTTFTTIVDILLVVFLIINIIIGIKRGFVKSFLGLFKNLFAFIIAIGFSDNLGSVIKARIMDSSFVDKLSHNVAGSLIDAGIAESGDVSSTIPGFLIDLLNFVHIDIESKFIIPVEESIAKNGNTADGIAEVVADPIAQMFAIIISFIILYVVSLILLTALAKILDKLCDLPLIRTANGILGGILGAICGIVYLWIIAKILVFLMGFGSGSDLEFLSFLDGFDPDDTIVLKVLNNLNPLKAVLKLSN